MALRIFTDSSCDIDLAEQTALDLTILPFPVFFGEDCYIEGENLTKEQFFDMLAKAETLPKTAQITPSQYEDIFRPLVEAGDEILLMPISRELSGTYQSARIAKESFPEASIYIVDTLHVTFGLGLLVYEAIEMRRKGMSGAEIYEELNALIPRMRLYALVDDLKYLKMGGRLSSAVAMVGTLLNIKPLINVAEGKVNNIGKARGRKAALQQVIELVAADDIDLSHLVTIGHSNDPTITEELQKLLAERWDIPRLKCQNIGPVVGTHIGPGCGGVAFIAREK